MTRNPSSFFQWVRHKFSFASKKRYAGATVEEGYFHYEAFRLDQPKTKSFDDLENGDISHSAIENELSKPPSPQTEFTEELNEKNSVVESLEKKKSAKRNSGAFKSRRNSKKKEQKKRMTVIPTFTNCSDEKFNTSPNENTFRRSVNRLSRLRFSFVGTLRKKLHKESGSAMHDSRDSKNSPDVSAATYQRSKRIMSAPSLKGLTSKSLADDINVRHSETSENLFKFSGDNIYKPNSASMSESKSQTKRGLSQSSLTENCKTQMTLNVEKETLSSNAIPLVKVSSFFQATPFPEVKLSKLTSPTNVLSISSNNEYIRFNVCRDKSHDKAPQSPSHRNSDPYVNLKFHQFNLCPPYGGSQESIKEDNYCLKFDELTPVVPPRTYKRNFRTSNFTRSARTYQSFSSFSTLAISSSNVNKTIQQLPKSVATKCEAFCKRIDALSTDYLPMNMHPLSNKLSLL